jgi:hypothetical protein
VSCDYSKLRGKIREVFGTQDAFAEAIRIGRVSLSQRLTGKLDFTQNEINSACEALGLDKGEIPLYFFTEKV